MDIISLGRILKPINIGAQILLLIEKNALYNHHNPSNKISKVKDPINKETKILLES